MACLSMWAGPRRAHTRATLWNTMEREHVHYVFFGARTDLTQICSDPVAPLRSAPGYGQGSCLSHWEASAGQPSSPMASKGRRNLPPHATATAGFRPHLYPRLAPNSSMPAADVTMYAASPTLRTASGEFTPRIRTKPTAAMIGTAATTPAL